jgi:hypothetical protein
MRDIASNELYDLQVDEGKNRVYLRIKGYWKSAETYLEDITKAAAMVSRG